MDYEVLGMYIGMSMLQGGPGLPVSSKHLYGYFTNGVYTYINLDIKSSEVPDPSVRAPLEKV